MTDFRSDTNRSVFISLAFMVVFPFIGFCFAIVQGSYILNFQRITLTPIHDLRAKNFHKVKPQNPDVKMPALARRAIEDGGLPVDEQMLDTPIAKALEKVCDHARP